MAITSGAQTFIMSYLNLAPGSHSKLEKHPQNKGFVMTRKTALLSIHHTKNKQAKSSKFLSPQQATVYCGILPLHRGQILLKC